MTLTEYNKLDVRKQKEEELSQLGLDQDEVELKMINSGLVAKVLYSCNHCSTCMYVQQYRGERINMANNRFLL